MWKWEGVDASISFADETAETSKHILALAGRQTGIPTEEPGVSTQTQTFGIPVHAVNNVFNRAHFYSLYCTQECE